MFRTSDHDQGTTWIEVTQGNNVHGIYQLFWTSLMSAIHLHKLASQLKVKVYMGSTIATYKIESNQKMETIETL